MVTEEPSLRTDLGLTPFRDFDYPRAWVGPLGGGAWPASAQAFRVEEIPLYPACGEGEHAALTVEKRDVTTRDLAAAVARRLGVAPAAVGYAGMKDKACVAVQGFTVTGSSEVSAREAFEAEGCRVLAATRHRNKLRLGHLAGNRFRVFLAGGGREETAAILRALATSGVPNYFGPQRFGARGDNAAAGVQVLRGRLRVNRWKRDLLVSALQSFLFNEVLARRLERGTWAAALPGDVLRREDSGGLFLCADPQTDGPRVVGFEVTPTGPIPGRKSVQPAAEAEALEASVLTAVGVDLELFAAETGSRRPLRARLEGGSVDEGEGGIWLSFALPPGAYATSVVREVTGTATRSRPAEVPNVPGAPDP